MSSHSNLPTMPDGSEEEEEEVEQPRRAVRWAVWIGVTVLATVIASVSDRLVDRVFYAFEDAPTLRREIQVRVLPSTPAAAAADRSEPRAVSDIPHAEPTKPDTTRPQADLVAIAPEPAGPEGEAGIAAAIRAGKLRPAGPADVSQWVARHRAQGGAVDAQAVEAWRMPAYVVTGDLTFPAGLNGAHAVIFVVPTGAPYPSGSAGHSLVLDVGSGACIGFSCSNLSH